MQLESNNKLRSIQMSSLNKKAVRLTTALSNAISLRLVADALSN